jgi:tripartite-type tricarboxylate transporter receptor subunit TctC
MKKTLLAILCAAPLAALAQSFPSKSIRIIVPYQAGGNAEVMARQVAEQMQQSLKQPVVIENRPGGGTTIGATAVAQAPADGYSIFLNASSFLINAQLMKNLAYDAWKDFIPLSLASSNAHLLVAHSGLGTPTFKEFLAMAKQKGASMSYASFGNGSSGHLGFELLKKAYDFQMVHVPYKGVPQAMTDVMAGQVQAMLTDLPPGAVQVRAGKMLGLAIAADQRSPTVPGVPTFQEATGTRFVSRSWFGFLVRTGTPPDIVKTLQSEIVRALRNPGVREKLTSIGMDPIGSTQDEFIAFMKSESEKFADAIKFSGTKID